MFDVGFSEILIIAVVALLVLGPERLPKAARFAGLWVRRARAQWYSVKAELERELANEELLRGLKTPLSELQPQMRALEKELRQEFADLAVAKPTSANTGAAELISGAPAAASTSGEAPAADAEILERPMLGHAAPSTDHASAEHRTRPASSDSQ